MTGNIFDIKRFAVHDGPGIRSTLFLKGCPLRCLWCHNPEGLDPAPRLWYFSNKCMACGLCIKACPSQALSKEKGGGYSISINHETCTSCAACVEVCPTAALEFDGREIDHTEGISLLMEDRAFYEESGGGVTLSGGDPVFQADFAALILEGCRQESVHTALESALYCSKATLEKLIPHTDLFIGDVKIMDDRKHKDYTAVSNTVILDNFRTLARKGKELFIRTPLIPGHTATEENMRAIADFLDELCQISGKAVRFELLNYNTLALNKYHIRKEENPALEKMNQIAPDIVKEWEALFLDKGIHVVSEHY